MTGLVSDIGSEWKLLECNLAADGSCLIACQANDAKHGVLGYFDGASGNVFAVENGAPNSKEAIREILETDPAVRFIGALDGPTGQLTVRQPEGNYLRICRWDRLSPETAAKSGAAFRTLPQCGCGGSLGSPKVFDSIADMAAYHFCAFYL